MLKKISPYFGDLPDDLTISSFSGWPIAVNKNAEISLVVLYTMLDTSRKNLYFLQFIDI